MEVSKIDEKTLQVVETETVEKTTHYSYEFLLKQRADILAQKEREMAQRDEELSKVDELIAHCEELGITKL